MKAPSTVARARHSFTLKSRKYQESIAYQLPPLTLSFRKEHRGATSSKESKSRASNHEEDGDLEILGRTSPDHAQYYQRVYWIAAFRAREWGRAVRKREAENATGGRCPQELPWIIPK